MLEKNKFLQFEEEKRTHTSIDFGTVPGASLNNMGELRVALLSAALIVGQILVGSATAATEVRRTDEGNDFSCASFLRLNYLVEPQGASNTHLVNEFTISSCGWFKPTVVVLVVAAVVWWS